MKKEVFIITVLALAAVCIYLFVEAPPPLAQQAQNGKMVPVETMFKVLAAENAAARALYTQEIVGPGIKAGLKFAENWRQPEVQAGPLPALMLRETAINLEKHAARVGLFLGSDFPIAQSNKFTGKQAEAFQKIRESKQAACVSCHNQHAQSPKKDWQLNDVMGATTWSYQQKEVSLAETLRLVGLLRQSFREAYESFLAKAKTYSSPPEIGTKWPRDGYYLPDADTLVQELTKRSSAATVDQLIKANSQLK
jgi:adenylate cyclase